MDPETRAVDLAASLVAESDYRDGLTRERLRREAEAHTAVSVQRPDDPPTVEDRRRYALTQARIDGHDVLRPGGQRPREHYAVVGPDGAAVVKAQLPRQVVWGPDTADQAEREWTQQIRERENEILIAAYGLKACRKAGLL